MDFDFLFTGQEIEWEGKKYLWLKTINSKLILAAEVGAELPAPVLVIPYPTKETEEE